MVPPSKLAQTLTKKLDHECERENSQHEHNAVPDEDAGY